MNKRGVAEWITQPKIRQILSAFSVPKTPRQAEEELGIKKLKLKPFLEKNLLEPLNPEARKGRYYITTAKAKRLLKITSQKQDDKDWDLIGWVKASPKQRLVVLKAVDSEKRTSEEIRERASQQNQHLTRISIKGILKELISKSMVETEMHERKRYYWISNEGMLLKSQLEL